MSIKNKKIIIEPSRELVGDLANTQLELRQINHGRCIHSNNYIGYKGEKNKVVFVKEFLKSNSLHNSNEPREIDELDLTRRCLEWDGTFRGQKERLLFMQLFKGNYKDRFLRLLKEKKKTGESLSETRIKTELKDILDFTITKQFLLTNYHELFRNLTLRENHYLDKLQLYVAAIDNLVFNELSSYNTKEHTDISSKLYPAILEELKTMATTFHSSRRIISLGDLKSDNIHIAYSGNNKRKESEKEIESLAFTDYGNLCLSKPLLDYASLITDYEGGLYFSDLISLKDRINLVIYAELQETDLFSQEKPEEEDAHNFLKCSELEDVLARVDKTIPFDPLLLGAVSGIAYSLLRTAGTYSLFKMDHREKFRDYRKREERNKFIKDNKLCRSNVYIPSRLQNMYEFLEGTEHFPHLKEFALFLSDKYKEENL